MIGKIITAAIGRRVAGQQNGVTGALIGAATPWLMRRAFTPAGLVVAGVIGAKMLYDRKRERDLAAARVDRVIRSEPITTPRSDATGTPAPQPATGSSTQL